MSSKYDAYWQTRLAEVKAAVDRAAEGETTRLNVGGIRQFGQRASWYGVVIVSSQGVLSAQMAHATALGRLVTEAGLADAWPDQEFRFSISQSCVLTVTSGAARGRVATADPLSQAEPMDLPPPSTSARNLSESRQVDVSEACRRIHQLLDSLPYLKDPDQVGFANGLYFFFEEGERSSHASEGRVVRVGNHPRSRGRLVGRLDDHYKTKRDAKDWSVFRRYLGGSLLRRADPNDPCLQPDPGRGHWEHGDQSACDICASVENEVTAYLTSRMRFRVVQVDDRETRNELEKRLIAALAGCPTCTPSPEWLGHFCYQQEVRSSGLWNQQHTTGPRMTEDDMEAFEKQVRGSVSQPSQRFSSSTVDELSDTLLIIPCSSSKQGADVPELPLNRVVDLLPSDEERVLEEGRRLAFERPGVTRNEQFPLEPALAVYTGQPYATSGFRELLLSALDRGMHCLIVSGGYGLLRPEEPINRYSAHLPTQTRSVWTRRLRSLIPSYVERHDIRRVFVGVSRSYASCLPSDFAAEEWWGVPTFDRRIDEGSPMRVVPQRVGRMVVDLLDGMVPGDGWTRVVP